MGDIKKNNLSCSEIKKREDLFPRTIKITGAVGVGKSKLISELNINKDETILVDFKGDIDFERKFSGAKIIQGPCFGSKEDIVNSLKSLKNEIEKKHYKIIIIDEAQILLRDNLIETFKSILNIIKDNNNQSILILGTQENTVFSDINTKDFEIKDFNQVAQITEDVNSYIKNYLL